MNYKKVTKNIRRELKTYIEDNGLKSLVLGVSGGIDSALFSALARPVCDELEIPLIGRSISIETNKPDEKSRAKAAGEAFCTEFSEIDSTQRYLNFVKPDITFPHMTTEDKIRCGNIKARMRMIHLYDLAQGAKGMVLSTDNLTELYLGFFTIHGDHADYGMFQNLWKTEVYELSTYLFKQYNVTPGEIKKARALAPCINAVPTDGLGITSSDLEQIGAKSYEEVDNLLKEFINPVTPIERIDDIQRHPVIQRHLNTKFKRNWPITIPREVILK